MTVRQTGAVDLLIAYPARVDFRKLPEAVQATLLEDLEWLAEDPTRADSTLEPLPTGEKTIPPVQRLYGTGYRLLVQRNARDLTVLSMLYDPWSFKDLRDTTHVEAAESKGVGFSLSSEDASAINKMNRAAALLWEKGDYQAARSLYERGLAIQEKTLGPNHPAIAQTLNNLAMLLKEEQDYGAAQDLLEQALKIQQVLGLEHPDTVRNLSNLAILLKAKGDYWPSRQLFEQVLAIQERTLGPEHPDTIQTLNNLAMVLGDQGDYELAQRFLMRAQELAIIVGLEGIQAKLTPREVKVLGLLIKGLSNRELANELAVSPRTVSTHIRNVLDKLGVQNRVQAALYAREHGLMR